MPEFLRPISGDASPATVKATGSTTARSNADRAAERVNVKDFGATGDGTTDDTATVQAAIAAAGSTRIVYYPAGVYLITDTLVLSTTGHSAYAWEGPRSARGCNVGTAHYPAVILFRPTDTTRPLVKVADTSSPTSVVGPFIHRNLMFDLAAANGFVFGLEDLDGDGGSDVVEDVGGQAYVVGVMFEGCHLSADFANRVSASGVLARTGRIMLHMTKCFESIVRNTSFFGSDIQVRTWGCDRPTFDGLRMQGAHLPFDINGSGSFTVQVALNNIEFEGWTFTPIRTVDCSLSAHDISIEQNDGTPTGSGRYSIPGTVEIAADSSTLVFEDDMDGVLFPGLSLVEVTDGANAILLLVTGVDGTDVTVDADTTGLDADYPTSTTSITWSAGEATATRIHGYGPLHNSKFHAAYSNVRADASTGCPAFVYVVNRGSLEVAASGESGNHSGIGAAVIGNIPSGPNYMNGHLSLASSPILVGDPSNPFVVCEHLGGGTRQPADDPNLRSQFGGLADAMTATGRSWAFTPRRSATSFDYSFSHNPVAPVPGDPGTTQVVHAWLKRDPEGLLHCTDESLPSLSGVHLRVRIRARSASSSGSLGWYFLGSGSGSGTTTVGLTDDWATYDAVVPIPSQWTGDRSGTTGIDFTGSGYYLAAVTVEEITPGTDGLITGDLEVGGTAAAPRVVTPFNPTDSTLAAGSFELQSRAVGDAWLAENAYFGSAWTRRAAGAASMLNFFNGSITFYVAASGSAGDSPAWVAALALAVDGSATFGGAISGSGSGLNSIPQSGVTGLTTDLAALDARIDALEEPEAVSFTPIARSAAPNNSIFLSTDDLDANDDPKLVRRGSGGNYTVFG